MALPPFQQNLMQSNNLQKKKKVEEELGKPAFKAQGLANQQPQVPAFQPAKKVEAPKDLKPPATLQPTTPIQPAPQAQPQPMLQAPKAVLEAPKIALTPMQPPAMAPVATPSLPTLPTLPTLQPPAMAPPVAPLAQAPALDRILAPLLQPPAERPMPLPPTLERPMPLAPMERPMPLAPKPSDVNLGNILGSLTQPVEPLKPSLAPKLEGLLKPIGEPPPLLQPQPPTFSPSAQLPQLPPRPQAGGLPPKPDLAGVLKPMVQREPPTPPKGAVTIDQIKASIRPDTQLTEMLKPVTISAGSVPTSQAGAGTETSPTTPSEISPGGSASSGASRFINFERLLSANQPMAGQMAERAIGEATSRGETAAKNLQNLSEQFQRDVAGGTNVVTNEGIGFTGNEGYDAYMQSLQGKPEERVGVLTPGAGGWATQSGISSAPGATMGVGPTVTLGEAQQRAERGYTGPSYSEFFSSPQYTEAQKAAQKAQEATSAMKSQEGLEAFMNQLYGTTGGAGGSRLDAALARVAGGERFKAPQERFKGLDKLFQEASGKAQSAVQQAEQQSAAGQEYWKNLVAEKQKEMADYDLRQTHEWKMANDPEYARAFNARGGEVAGSMYDNPYT